MKFLKRPVLALGLVLAGWLLQGGTAAAYTCWSPHCYGIVRWQEQPEYFGAYTDITLGRITCSGCDGFVTNEVWLVQRPSAECPQQCWVEAGYTTDGGHNGPYFFWDEVPPGGQYVQHNLGPADPVGSVDHFMIVKDGRVSPATFLVFIYNDTFSTLYGGLSATRTATAMVADHIDMGQELFGSRGITTSATAFTRNIRAVVPLGPEYVFWYWPQTTPGFVMQDMPPFAWWDTLPPVPFGSPEGGRFMTWTP